MLHRRFAAIALAASTAFTGLASAVAAPEPIESPSCFWGQPTSPRHGGSNWLSNDGGATYWGARVILPPGSHLELRGAFPHARYMSFNVYDEQLAAVDALADVSIAPDEGSTNPFLPGADRAVTDRAYTAFIRSGPPPAMPEANTLYASTSTGQPLPVAMLLYRIYIQDADTDLTGDVGLPSVTLIDASGQAWDLTAACTDEDANDPGAGLPGGGNTATTPSTGSGAPARNPIVWEKFFNLAHSVTAPYLNDSALEPIADEQLGKPTGGYLSNADIAYASASINRAYGDVLTLRFKAPLVPATRDGAATMGSGQMRYWSVCSYDRATRVVDCVFDEDAIPDANGIVTLAVSTPEHRPANATAACGVAWMDWGANPSGQLILRHMLVEPDFEHGLDRVSRPDEIDAVVGEYLPVGTHSSTEAFTAPAC